MCGLEKVCFAVSDCLLSVLLPWETQAHTSELRVVGKAIRVYTTSGVHVLIHVLALHWVWWGSVAKLFAKLLN